MSLVNNTVQFIWDVNVLVSNTVQFIWDVNVLVNNTVQTIWDVNFLVSDTVQFIWNVEVLGVGRGLGMTLYPRKQSLNVGNRSLDMTLLWRK